MLSRQTSLRTALIIAFSCCFFQSAQAQTARPVITSHYATVDGVRLHYLQTGHGPAVLLIHGFAETSLMWNQAMQELAGRFTLIAPDLPGFGDSAIPTEPQQFRTTAAAFHDLLHSLGIKSERVVGHDIGLMAAYAYAAQFPAETEKLVLMDALLPGIGNWQSIYDNPGIWHFRFNGPIPEALVRGRESIYFRQFWDDFAADKDHSIPAADRAAYLRAYSRPGRMRAAWNYFKAFPQTALDFASFVKTPLPMPILVVGGGKANGTELAAEVKLTGPNVKVVILPNTGHWVMEENYKGSMAALTEFL
jgi:pimeloyl-ACP methyl ester carboxylesterase